ncbi:MAG TPA: hypothetical protein ENJ28_09140 [Gammaproteobacteria bacterium]|nr:hypothetical protein [Gammaproteobacteria bacterium]
MNIPEIEINFDSDKVCRLMPVVVSIACISLFSVVQIIDIPMVYTAFLMLFTGLAGFYYLVRIKHKDQQDLVPLKEMDELLFEDSDPTEMMLQNLEAITILINELSARQIETSRIQTEDAVTALINRFMRLSEELNSFAKAHQLQGDSEIIRLNEGFSDILVSFQFQDRTSQILSHVANSLELLNDEIKTVQGLREKGAEPEYNQDEILKKVAAGFTTAEQRSMLSPNASAESANNVELF